MVMTGNGQRTTRAAPGDENGPHFNKYSSAKRLVQTILSACPNTRAARAWGRRNRGQKATAVKWCAPDIGIVVIAACCNAASSKSWPGVSSWTKIQKGSSSRINRPKRAFRRKISATTCTRTPVKSRQSIPSPDGRAAIRCSAR